MENINPAPSAGLREQDLRALGEIEHALAKLVEEEAEQEEEEGAAAR